MRDVIVAYLRERVRARVLVPLALLLALTGGCSLPQVVSIRERSSSRPRKRLCSRWRFGCGTISRIATRIAFAVHTASWRGQRALRRFSFSLRSSPSAG
jgi:hypothetical protein